MFCKDYTITAVSTAGPSGIKITVNDAQDRLLDFLEVSDGDIHAVLSFIKEQKECRNALIVVGCPYDHWPIGLKGILESNGHKIEWLDPRFTREVMQGLVRWNRLRRLHRARTLAHIYRLYGNMLKPPEPYGVAARWERKVAQDIIGELHFYS